MIMIQEMQQLMIILIMIKELQQSMRIYKDSRQSMMMVKEVSYYWIKESIMMTMLI